jgi:hypothetical protein
LKYGFSNKVTAHAPQEIHQNGIEPAIIHNRARLPKPRPEMTLEAASRFGLANINSLKGWPVTIQQEDNYGRKLYGYLPN